MLLCEHEEEMQQLHRNGGGHGERTLRPALQQMGKVRQRIECAVDYPSPEYSTTLARWTKRDRGGDTQEPRWYGCLGGVGKLSEEEEEEEASKEKHLCFNVQGV